MKLQTTPKQIDYAIMVEPLKVEDGGGWLASMNRLLSGSNSRTNQRAQSATVGIRGFSKDDLAQAELNPAEFAKGPRSIPDRRYSRSPT